MRVPIEISARHIHLKKTDLELLFGKGYELKVLRDITQPGQFACRETVTIKNGINEINNVRIIGPCRDYTQVELSKTDAHNLSMDVPIKNSGEINDTPGICILGPKGRLIIKNGVIIPERHLHISPDEAKKLNLRHLQLISISISGKRSLIFNNVVVNSRQNIDKLSFQIDPDEANAADVKNGDYGEIV
jgi:putative phosphotransacetylase